MNKNKIEEIAYGAEVWSKEDSFQVDLEVFAKLIIRECTNTFIKAYGSDINPKIAIEAVNTHFGIES